MDPKTTFAEMGQTTEEPATLAYEPPTIEEVGAIEGVNQGTGSTLKDVSSSLRNMAPSLRLRDYVRPFVDAEGGAFLDLRSGRYFCLNSAGVEMWQRLEAGLTTTQVEEHLTGATRRDAATVHNDVTAFIGRLLKADLVCIETNDRSRM